MEIKAKLMMADHAKRIEELEQQLKLLVGQHRAMAEYVATLPRKRGRPPADAPQLPEHETADG